MMSEESKVESGKLESGKLEGFDCAICHAVLCWDPVVACTNEHLFCRACLTQWSAKPSSACPSCRGKLSPKDLNQSSPLLWRILSRQKINCMHKGCSWTGDYGDALNVHIPRDCLFETIKCQFQCGVSSERKTMSDHLKICVKRTEPCPHCQQSILHLEFDNHLALCDQMMLSCECGDKIARGKMNLHRSRDCKNETIDCPLAQEINVNEYLYEPVACSAKLMRGKLVEHIMGEYSHVLALMKSGKDRRGWGWTWKGADGVIRGFQPFKGMQLDIRDRVGKWCLATIIQYDETIHRIEVHFVGFAKLWDEWVLRKDSDERCAPPRSWSDIKLPASHWSIKANTVQVRAWQDFILVKRGDWITGPVIQRDGAQFKTRFITPPGDCYEHWEHFLAPDTRKPPDTL